MKDELKQPLAASQELLETPILPISPLQSDLRVRSSAFRRRSAGLPAEAGATNVRISWNMLQNSNISGGKMPVFRFYRLYHLT
jgi:hypothetical protein